MKVAILSTTSLWVPHHAEALDLAKLHLSLGDEVFFLSCDSGALAGCPANPFQDEDMCTNCALQSNHSVRRFFDSPDFHYVGVPKISNFASVDFEQNHKGIFAFVYEGAPLGSLVWSQLADEQNDAYPDLGDKSVFRRAKYLLASAISLFEFSISFLDEKGVDLVYVWNGRRPSDGPALWAARKLGISARVYITGGARGNIEVSQGSSIQDVTVRLGEFRGHIDKVRNKEGDRRIQILGQRFIRAYIKGKMQQPGFPSYTRKFRKHDLSGEKIILLVMSSPAEHLHLKDYRDFFSLDYLSWIGDALEVLADRFPSHKLVVKWHPSQIDSGPGERGLIFRVCSETPSATHILPDDNIDLYALIRQSDLVLTMGSVSTIAAVLWGKPTVVLGPYSQFFGSSAYQILDLPVSAELAKLLVDGLPHPKPKDHALEYGAWLSSFGHPFFRVRVPPWFWYEPTLEGRLVRRLSSRTLVSDIIKPLLRKFGKMWNV